MIVSKLIDDLGGPARLGAEIGAKANTVATWKKRRRIPAEWWSDVSRVAQRSGLMEVTVERFAAFEAAKRASHCLLDTAEAA